MADSSSKKDNKKKKLQKQKEKNLRREDRKLNNNKGKSLEEQLVYVDEFGHFTSTPPANRTEVKLEDIRLGATPIEEAPEFYTGVITYFGDKGYGFITENDTEERVFFHQNNCTVPVKMNQKVQFKKERTARGIAAIQIEISH